jgi:hypothetical protein
MMALLPELPRYSARKRYAAIILSFAHSCLDLCQLCQQFRINPIIHLLTGLAALWLAHVLCSFATRRISHQSPPIAIADFAYQPSASCIAPRLIPLIHRQQHFQPSFYPMPLGSLKKNFFERGTHWVETRLKPLSAMDKDDKGDCNVAIGRMSASCMAGLRQLQRCIAAALAMHDMAAMHWPGCD